MASAPGSWIGKLGEAGGEDSGKFAATRSRTTIFEMSEDWSKRFQKEGADCAQKSGTQGLKTAISKLRHGSPGRAGGAQRNGATCPQHCNKSIRWLWEKSPCDGGER